jgi:hypothetical protein
MAWVDQMDSHRERMASSRPAVVGIAGGVSRAHFARGRSRSGSNVPSSLLVPAGLPEDDLLPRGDVHARDDFSFFLPERSAIVRHHSGLLRVAIGGRREFLDSVHGFLAQSRRFACNACLAQPFDLDHSSVERLNKLAERTYHEIAISHGLVSCTPYCTRSDQRVTGGTDKDRSRNRRSQSRKTTFKRELWTFKSPLYSMNPSFRNLFMKKFTRERVVPTISASVSCDTFGSVRCDASGSP